MATPERTYRADRSRRAILEAAAPEFAAHGFAGASLNRIIRASGLTKGGFYFHFPSKQALALAVLGDQYERWWARVLSEVGPLPRAVDRLFATPRVIARQIREGEGPGTLGKLIEELARDPDLRDEVCGSLRIAVEMTTAQFAEAQAEGDIRPDLDPALLAEVAVGGFAGMQTMTEQLADDDLERRVEALILVVRTATTSPQEGGPS